MFKSSYLSWLFLVTLLAGCSRDNKEDNEPQPLIAEDQQIAIIMGSGAESFESPSFFVQSIEQLVFASSSSKLSLMPSSMLAKLNGVKDFVVGDDKILILQKNGRAVFWDSKTPDDEQSTINQQLYDVKKVLQNNGRFFALRNDGSVVYIGYESTASSGYILRPELSNIKDIISSSEGTFAALKNDGTVATWGYSAFGGDSSGVRHLLTNVTSLTSDLYSFAALREDGKVLTWTGTGSKQDDSAFIFDDIKQVIPTRYYLGLTNDNMISVRQSTENSTTYQSIKDELVDIKQVASNVQADAVLREDGKVFTWGDIFDGANISADAPYGGDIAALHADLDSVSKLFNTSFAFAALKTDGTVVVWGEHTLVEQFYLVREQLVNVTKIFSSRNTFVALKEDGSLVVWGGDPEKEYDAGNISLVKDRLVDIKTVYAARDGFIAVQKNGELVPWGTFSVELLADDVLKPFITVSQIIPDKPALPDQDFDSDGIADQYDLDDDNDGVADKDDAFPLNSSETMDSDGDGIGDNADKFDDIFDNSPVKVVLSGDNPRGDNEAFIVLRNNSAVLATNSWKINQMPSSIVAKLSDAKEIITLHNAIAILLNSGELVYWDGEQPNADHSALLADLTNVKQVITTALAFAALRNDGKVVSWGEPNYGGDVNSSLPNLSNVSSLASSNGAFIALKDDGTVVSWGSPSFGGDISEIAHLLTDIVQITSATYSSAAIKSDGSVIHWNAEGQLIEQEVTGQYENVAKLHLTHYIAETQDQSVAYLDRGDDVVTFSSVETELYNLIQLAYTSNSYAALRADGQVFTWGDREANHSYWEYALYGGDSSAVKLELKQVVKLYSTSGAFAALKSNGSVVAWGNPQKGGNTGYVQSQLTNVVKLVSTHDTFAALTEQGKLLVWGGDAFGPNEAGNTTAVADKLNDIIDVYATDSSFIALTKSGEVISWGALSADNLGKDIVKRKRGRSTLIPF